MKTMKRMTAFVLMAIMAVAMLGSVSAFAVDEVPTFDPADLHVSKLLVTNQKSTVDATFKFTATPTTVADAEAADPTVNTFPTVTISDITVNKTDTDTTETRVPKSGMTDAELASNTQGKISFSGAWPHAGVYAYTIREVTTGTDAPAHIRADEHDLMTYDTTSRYTMRVYVKNDGTGLSIEKITIEDKDGNKVERAGILFTNRYVEGTDLQVGKDVRGDLADKTKPFKFTVRFTKPSTIDTMPDGTPWDPTSIIVSTAENGTANNYPVLNADGTTTAGSYVTVGSDGVAEFYVKHGDRLWFGNLPAGTTDTIQEAAAADYTATAAYVENGTAGSGSAAKGVGYTGSSRFIGENTNSNIITNTTESITHTGMFLDMVPFIVLGVLAVGGMIVYLTLKRRLRQ